MWFEHTIEGPEFDLMVCGELEEVVTEWRIEPGVGHVPVATAVEFSGLEASRVFDDRWEDLPEEDAARLAREHESAILEAAIDASLPTD